MQYLVIIGLVLIVYFFFIKKKPLSQKKETPKAEKETPKANDMVECFGCGIYSELDESILSSGKYFCSKDCVDKEK